MIRRLAKLNDRPLLGIARMALFAGMVLLVSSFVVVHPLVHVNGTVHYPWQAISIAKRADCVKYVDRSVRSLPWQAELTDDIWQAGFSNQDGQVIVSIDAQTGRTTDCRIGAF
jgi:hypothetical protein